MDTSADVTLIPVKTSPDAMRSDLLAGICALELAPAQAAFVGEPSAMAQVALAEPDRHIFAVTAVAQSPALADSMPGALGGGRVVVGMGVLHVGAARSAGWHDNEAAILLRGFLVDRRVQGMGYGTAATEAAVELAGNLAAELALPALGLVLGVNERNAAGIRAYGKAGFGDVGLYLGGRSGPQRIMYRPFDAF